MTFSTALVDENHPLEFKQEVPPEVLGIEDAALQPTKPILADLTVVKDEENFLVTGWLQTSFDLVCGRCAETFPFAIRAKVEHLLEPPHPNSIDLTPFIREDILLELPLNAVCRLGADGRLPGHW